VDADRFDIFTRSLTRNLHRRSFGLFSTLGLAGLAVSGSAVARKKPCLPCKKRKKGKCKANRPNGTRCPGGAWQGGRCAPPSCMDGVKNGNETDVDCGGNCPRCLNGRTCSGRNDCVGAFCKDGTCEACQANPECGTDDNGACACQQPATGGSLVCTGTAVPPNVASCVDCPASTICVASPSPGTFYCFKPCGVR